MNLCELLERENIYDVRYAFDRYMELYPNINEYLKYYALLENIIIKANKSDLFAYIVDYLFHDSYQNVYVNINEMLRYISIHHTDILLPTSHIKFYKKVLTLESFSVEELLYYFNIFKKEKIYLMFYHDIRKLKDKSYDEILTDLTDLTLFEPNYEINDISVYDLRPIKYKLLVRSSRKFKKYSCYYKSYYSIITSIHNRTFGRENDSLSFDYGYLCADVNKILHVSERDLLSKYSDEHDCGTLAPNRIVNLYSLTEFDSSWSEIQILNLKDTDNYKCLKPDFIISYIEQIKPKILNEAQRLGIPVVIVNNRSLESLDSDWLENEKYNTYYANPEFDKSVNFVLR